MKKSELLEQLQHAYDRLQDALRVSLEQELSIDGTIQRFEFTFELTWKTLYRRPGDSMLFSKNVPQGGIQNRLDKG